MLCPLAAYANPQGGVVNAGQASISSSGSTLLVHQQTDRAVIDWQGFDIGATETTEFQQPNSSSIALNRVHSAQPSVIDGTLKANGNLLIVNQNGVLFGQHAVVDVNGLVATSADVDNDRFMNDPQPRLNKPGAPDASVVNQGSITARDSGLVGFVAPHVENSGVITARLGRVHLAAGDTATVDFYGDGLMEVAVSDEVHQQLVRNTGNIRADGGTVALTAAAGSTLLASTIEARGAISAQSVATRDGKIIIAALGNHAVAGNLAVAKNSAKPARSQVLVAGHLDASGSRAGEKGGAITVTADAVTVKNGSQLKASGTAGGGVIRVGGEYLGRGSTPTALTTTVESGATLNASATGAGHGGEIIVFADGTTHFAGFAQANGAGQAGNGGFVETSGKAFLDFNGAVQAAASGTGRAGTWLLDPADITITAATNSNITGATPFTATAAASQLSAATIVAALNAGTNVTVQTTNDAFAGNGDILVNAAITSTGTGALTLSAFRNIAVSSAISLNGGALTLRSDNTGIGSGAVTTTANISTNGGNVTIGGSSGAITAATLAANGSITTAATGYAQGNATRPVGVSIGANITAAGGNVLINGQGENSTNVSQGVELTSGNTISTTGTGAIRINGIGRGTAGNSNQIHGVALRSLVTSVNGNIELTGTAGGGSGAANTGVLLSSTGGGIARTTGSGNIVVNGTAGTTSGVSYGVLSNFANGLNATGTGAITVFGSGGTGTVGQKIGIGVSQGTAGSITASGGNITLTGTGGANSTANNNYGVAVIGGTGVTTSGAGTITVTGTGGGTGSSSGNDGVFVGTAGGTIASSGSGAITITGTGGNGTGGANNGVNVTIASGIANSSTGNITINSAAGGTSGVGFRTNVANGVRTSGTSGNITVNSDTYSLNLANNINSVAGLTIAPRTAITMGVGSGAGTLQFTDTLIGFTNAVTYTYGSTTATGLTVNTALPFTGRNLAFISGGNLTITNAFDGTGTFTTTAASGTTTLNGVLGGTTAVGTVTLNGRDLFLNANLRSSGNINAAFSRDITLAAGQTVTPGSGSALTLTAAGNNVNNTGNLTLNGILNVGTGTLTLTSGVNGTRPSWTATAANLLRQGANFGTINIQGFLDTFISRDVQSSGSITINSFRDLTIDAANFVRSGASNGLSLRAANSNPAGTGALYLNGTLFNGTGGLTLISGSNPTRPSYTATATNLQRLGATFGAIDIEGFADFVANRLFNSTSSVLFTANTRTVLQNNVTSSGGAISFNNPVAVDESYSVTVSTTNQPITFGASVSDTPGGVTESLTVNSGTALTTFGGTVDGVALNATAGSFSFASPLGATRTLGATSITSTNALVTPDITASSLSVQTTAAGAPLSIGGLLATTGAGNSLSVSSNGLIIKTGAGDISSNNGPISLNAATYLQFANNFSLLSNGGNLALTGPSGIINSGTVGITSGGGNLNVASPLIVAAPLTIDLGTGALTLASTVNGSAPFGGTFSVLAVGGGGGGGGRDSGTNGGGGGSGGAVDTVVNASGLAYTIAVGGGGGGGGNSLSSAPGGAGGTNGGGAGGAAGPGGSSGGGGGGGGYSAVYSGSTYYAVAGGGAGGGGGNEGFANDAAAQGGGSQTSNTGTLNGGAGAAFAGDGGGGGGGGGGYFGGVGQTGLATSIAAAFTNGGGSYYNPTNASGTYTAGNNGATQPGGSTGGAATAISAGQATYYNYGNNAGAGGTAVGGSSPGSNGIVIIRYTGTPGQSLVIGGTVTTVGGDTLVTYTSTTGGLFSPVTSCSGNCNLSITAGSVSFGGAIGGVNALDNVSITTPGALGLPSITAASIFARTLNATADLSINSGSTLTTTGSGNALTLVAGQNFVNNAGSGALNVTGGGRFLVYSNNPGSDTTGGVTSTFRRYSCAYGGVGACAYSAALGTTVSIPAGGNGFLYSQTVPFITITPAAVAVIYGNAAPLTGYAYAPITAAQYANAADFAADTITGSLNGTSTYVAGNAGGAAGNVYNINYASGTLVSALGYGFTYANNPTAITVTPRTVTASLIGTVSKTYDGNALATLAGGNYSLSNLFGSDTLGVTSTAASYNDKNVGTGKLVTATGVSISGALAGNYTLASSTATGNIGSITQRALTISATSPGKVYDGNAIAPITLSDNRVAGDVLTLGYATALFPDKNVGIGRLITVNGITLGSTDAGNYSFNSSATTNADITTRALTISAASPGKVYDGTAIAPVTLSDNRLAGDVLTLNYATALFPDKNVGVGRTVTVNGITLGSTDAGNYSFNTSATTTASITQRALTISAASPGKVYDGNAIAPITLSDNRVAGDVLTLGYASALFPDKNVGTGRLVTVNGLTLGSTDAGNYTFNTATTTTADITPRALTISAAGIAKTYDGTTAASVTLSDNRIAGDTLNTAYASALFVTPNAGAARGVNVTGITLTGSDSGNYSFNSTASTTANITQASLIVTADPQTVIYGTAVPGSTVSYSGFVTGEDASFLTVAPTVSSVRSGLQNVGTYAANYSASGGVSGNYSFTYVPGSLSVTPKALNVTADTQTITYGTPVPAGTLSYSGFIAGEDASFLATLPTVSSAVSGVQNVGTYVGNYTVSGGSAANYTLNYFSGNLVVNQRNLNITADNKTVNYGTAVPTGSFQYSGFIAGDSAADLDSLPTVSSALSGIQNAATYTGNYTVSGGSDNNYHYVFVPGTLTVNPAGLNVTVANQTVTYGTAVPTSTITYTGFVMGEDETFLTAVPTISSAQSGIVNASTYTGNYTASGGVSSNYSFNYIPGDLTVSKKSLNVTAGNRTVTYGTAVPASSIAYSGFIPGEDATYLTTAPTLSSAQSGVVNAGTYTANYTVGGGVSPNYSFNYTAGDLVVARQTLTVTAANQSILYGATVPLGTLSYSGFVNGENASALIAAPTVSSDLSGVQPAGSYAGNYTVAGGSSNNYTFSYVAGDLTILQRTLNVTALNQTVTYGTAVPAITLVYSGFAPGENATFLATAPTGSSALSGIQHVGTYAANYSVGGGVDGNYVFVYNAGDLVVTPAALTIRANNVALTYGAPNALAGYSISGLQNGETVGSVTLTASAPLSSSNHWRAGSWSITPSAASGGNFTPSDYAITYLNGSLSVGQRALTITASSPGKTYDGSATAPITLGDDRVAGDVLATSYAQALFPNKNAGIGRTVTVTGLGLSGADSANYVYNTVTTTTADITPRSLSFTVTSPGKVYDGTAIAPVNFSDNRVAGDMLGFSYNALFPDKNVGTGRAINVTAIALTGADRLNYSLPATSAATTGTITPRALIISASGIAKPYDGTTNAQVTLSDNRVAGDALSTAYGSAQFASIGAGPNRLINVSGITLGGVDSGNYIANTSAIAFADITGSGPQAVGDAGLPNTVIKVTQDPNTTVAAPPDDGIYATPVANYVLVYLPQNAPLSNQLLNAPVPKPAQADLEPGSGVFDEDEWRRLRDQSQLAI